ncbi:uncharacterized protein LOC135814682 [Sycon ciliatum]|uniref:uncharacterized protein LOC135814682 n=1 Tax=Sycon ciliatum TaxID=27933 RepID=UPI0031F66C91
MTTSRRGVGWWLAWLTVTSLLVASTSGHAAHNGIRSAFTPSTCKLERKQLKTIPNRMISTRSSFRNGAKEVRFLRAKSRSECNDWCCSYDACDTVMFIGPDASVWRSRTPEQVATEENCALLACNHFCVVDRAAHQGIYISKVSDAPFGSQALPERIIQHSVTDVERIEATQPVVTTHSVETTSKPSPTTTPLIATTSVTTTVAVTTHTVTTRQDLATTSNIPTTQRATYTSPAMDQTSESASEQETGTAVASSDSAMMSNMSGTDPPPTDAHAEPSESSTDAARATGLKGDALLKAVSSTPDPINANARFSGTSTLIIGLAVGLLAFFAVFFMVSRQWVRFARTRVHKQKEDYLINGMYA